MICSILAMLYLIYMIGYHVGESYVRGKTRAEACRDNPPLGIPAGFRNWSGKTTVGEMVIYHCSRHRSSYVYKIVECNYETRDWVTLYEKVCGCFDDLPPVSGFMYRTPDVILRYIGAKVVYKCSRRPGALAYLIYVCNATSSWQLVLGRFNNDTVCDCYPGEPPPSLDPRKRDWPRRNTLIGSLAYYFCGTDISESAIEYVYQCQETPNKNAWVKIYERNCTCTLRPPNLELPRKYNYLFTEHHKMNEDVTLYCIPHNDKSGIRYKLHCDWSGKWTVMETGRCKTKFAIFDKRSSFLEARKHCQNFGGDYPLLYQESDRLAVEDVILKSNSTCHAVYFGVYEDAKKAWVTSDMDKTMISLPIVGSTTTRCLLVSYAITKYNYKLIPGKCSEKNCFICYFPLNPENSYRVYDFPKDFNKAQETCFVDHGIMVPPRQKYLDEIHIRLRTLTRCKKQFFIGARSFGRHWINWDETEVIETNWASGQPKNFQSQCAVMWYFNKFKWYDMGCSQGFCFVCQIPEDKEVTLEQKVEKQESCESPEELPYFQSCILIKTARMTHKEAEMYCQQKGKELLSLHSEADSNALTYYLSLLYGVDSNETWHIGYKKIFGVDQKGRIFTTERWTSGQKVSYTAIVDYKPDYEGSLHEHTGDLCAVVALRNYYRWNLIDCNTHKGSFVCINDTLCPPPPTFQSNAIVESPEIIERKAGDIFRIRCTDDPKSNILRSFYCSPKIKQWMTLPQKQHSTCDTKIKPVLFKLNRSEAISECESLGGHLFFPRSLLSYTKMIDYVTDARICPRYHIGIREDCSKQWISRMFYYPFDKSVWSPGFPENHDDMCVIVSINDHLLQNVNCEDFYCSLCESLVYSNPKNYYLNREKSNRETAFHTCSSNGSTLAVVWKKEDMDSILQFLTTVSDLICKAVYIDLMVSERFWIYYKSNKNVPSYIYPNKREDGPKPTLSSNCMFISSTTFQLQERKCDELNCFLCELPEPVPSSNLVYHDNYEIPPMPPFEFVENIDQVNESNAYFRYIRRPLDSRKAHKECLKHRGFLATIGSLKELEFVTTLVYDLKEGEHIHTGLFFDVNLKGWKWMDDVPFSNYPPIVTLLRTRYETQCITLVMSAGESLRWDFDYNGCDNPHPFICRHYREYMGIQKETIFGPPLKLINEADLNICGTGCFEYNFFSITSELRCACYNQILDLKKMGYDLTEESFLSVQENICEDPNYCLITPQHICGCANGVIAFMIRHDIELGCFYIKLKSNKDGRKSFVNPKEALPKKFHMVQCISQCKKLSKHYAAQTAFKDCYCLETTNMLDMTKQGEACRFDSKKLYDGYKRKVLVYKLYQDIPV